MIEVGEWIGENRSIICKLTLRSDKYKTFIWDVGDKRVIIRFKAKTCLGWEPSEKSLSELSGLIEGEIRNCAGIARTEST